MESWDITELQIEAHAPQILRSDEAGRLIAIHLPAGEALGEHQVHEGAYLVVLSGEVEVEAGGTSADGGAGLTVFWDAGERHSVRARSDARLILLLAPWPGEGHPSQVA
jgi:quercetin dioxygenase-like cupin family protein